MEVQINRKLNALRMGSIAKSNRKRSPGIEYKIDCGYPFLIRLEQNKILKITLTGERSGKERNLKGTIVVFRRQLIHPLSLNWDGI